MNRVLTYEMTAEQTGMKVGDFLRKNGYSRRVIIHLQKAENGILLKGE